MTEQGKAPAAGDLPDRDDVRAQRVEAMCPESHNDGRALLTICIECYEKALSALLLEARGWVAACAKNSPTFYECKDAQRTLDRIDAALRATELAASAGEPAEGRPSPEIPAIPDSKG